MSEITAYLIPKKDFVVGEFKSKVETVFAIFKIINGYYDKENSWFAPGENAYLLFEDKRPFEYVEIHGTENNRLIPEGLQEKVECKFCYTDIKEDVNDRLFTTTEKEYDEKKETDLASAEIVCSNCGQTSILSSLIYHEKIAFTNQYICFVAISDDINMEKLVELEKQLDTSFEIFYDSI